MKKVTVRAKTVEDAVKSALSQLQTTEEFVNIRVIEEPSKGFLGFGAKQAVVEVEHKPSEVDDIGTNCATSEPRHSENRSTVENRQFVDHSQDADKRDEEEGDQGVDTELEQQQAVERAALFLHQVLRQMGVEATIHKKKQSDHWLFDISGTQLGVVIGRRGQTLDALQYLTNIVANRQLQAYTRIHLDAENYRFRRKEALEQLADRVAKKVIRTRTQVALEPMNAAERKIIHTHLQAYAGVETKSDGKEPKRYIVIYPR